MNITLTFKTPDVTDAVEEYIVKHCPEHDQFDKDCDACWERVREAKYEVQELKEQLRKFVEYDEYVRIEFDTEAGTATVLPLKRAH